MNTILVTGGAGFLGSWFVRGWLAENRGRVVVLDKLTYAGNLASLATVKDSPQFVFRRGDIADRELVNTLLEEYLPYAIVNFAAETHVDRSIDAPAEFVSTNVLGTMQLLEAALYHWQRIGNEESHARFRFLHVSTDEVFGPIESPLRVTETAAYHPSSPYAASKASADHFVRAYHRTYGMPTLVVHPSNCYGPYQFPEKLVPIVILNALEGRQIPLYGSGSQQRDWLFGEDLCRAIGLVLQRGQPGESFNVATGKERTNRELIERVCSIVEKRCPDFPHGAYHGLVANVADRPGHDERYALDTQKICELGWRSQVELADGLEQTVRWYVENRAWVEQVSVNFDRNRRLGLALR